MILNDRARPLVLCLLWLVLNPAAVTAAAPGTGKTGSIQTLVARPEVPDGHRMPLGILLPGGEGRLPQATHVMSRIGNPLAERGWMVVVPVSPDGASFFGDAADQVVSVMDRLQNDPDIRPGRVLLVGVSNGAISALQVASMVPSRISGVIAQPGMLHPEVVLRRLANVPVYFRIGAEDRLGWADHYDDIVGKLTRAGVRLDAKLLEGVGHGIPADWTEMDAWIARELGAMAPAPAREVRVSLPADAARVRVWTDRNGATLEAALAEIREQDVILMRRDGTKLRIPKPNLSGADRAFLKNLIHAADAMPIR